MITENWLEINGSMVPVVEFMGLFTGLFAGRTDVVPRYWQSKDGKSPGYTPICLYEWQEGVCQKGKKTSPCRDCPNKNYVPLSDELLLKHFMGQHILGIYPLLQDNTCWFISGDFDNHDGHRDPRQDIKEFHAVCDLQDIPCYPLRSKSGGGYHAPIFFDKPIPAWKARMVTFALLREAKIIGEDAEINSFDRLFPGQDEITASKQLGNLIALPFQGKAMKNGNTLFLDPATDFMKPYQDQLEVMRTIIRVTEADLDRIIQDWGLKRDSSLVSKPTQSPMIHQPKGPVDNVIPDGQRNSVLISIAGTMRRRGLEYEEILPALASINERRCNPPLDQSEIEVIAASVSRYEPEDNITGESKEISLDTAREKLKNLPEKIKLDPGIVFKPEYLDALGEIQQNDLAEWTRTRKLLQKEKISLKDLERAFSQQKQASAQPEVVSSICPYVIQNGSIYYLKSTQMGELPVPLCNFEARIISEEVRDDGAETIRIFEINGSLATGQPLSKILVSADRFQSLAWVTAAWGSSPIIFAGTSNKDHLRTAIQVLSGNAPKKNIYAHTGWRKINGEWLYLHAKGAIGKDGPVSSLEVDFGESRLNDYVLPEIKDAAEIKVCIEASLRFLDVAPRKITFSLLAGVYRAILGEVLPIDLSLFVDGPTGSQKTEITAILMAHMGAKFHGKHLPANWASTGNALEKSAFLTKDAILAVDDFAPTGSVADIQKMHRNADRLLRGQGNCSGRQRMKSDGSLQPEYFPRGLVVSSGEDIPKGQSLRGRMVSLGLDKGDVKLDVLTELQEYAADGLMAGAMSRYIQWLAPQIDTLKKELRATRDELRNQLRKEIATLHDRTPDNVASLAIGWGLFLQFTKDMQAITDHEMKNYWDRGWEALKEAAQAQDQNILSQDPTVQFRELLAAAISGGYIHLVDITTNTSPIDPGNWGWQRRATGSNQFGWFAQGNKAGWVGGNGNDLYLMPDVVFAAIQKLAQSQGTSISVTKQTLWKRLAEKGLLLSMAKGRNLTRISIGNSRPWVLHLSKNFFLQDEVITPKSAPIELSDPATGNHAVLKAGKLDQNLNELDQSGSTLDPEKESETQSYSDSGSTGSVVSKIEDTGSSGKFILPPPPDFSDLEIDFSKLI